MESADNPKERCYTVAEITSLIRDLLELEFFKLTVEGEISNFHPSSTGHLYFSLKDEQSVLSVVMFKNRSFGLNFKPADGMVVRASGNISVYAKRGTYQLICESLVKAGEGELLALLEKRKAKLAALSPEQVTAETLAGEPITAKLTHAPANGAAIGGLKVCTENGWFAARPSGTEDIYKIYAESFKGEDHLKQIQAEAREIVNKALK